MKTSGSFSRATARAALTLVALFPPWPGRTAPLAPASPIAEEVWRINVGANTFDFTDSLGRWWSKDEPFDSLGRWGYDGGQAADASPRPIDGTELDAVYQTHRFGGPSFAYRVAVPNGRYKVTLHFAEVFWTEPGRRVFDVALEGVKVLSGHDVFSEVGRDAPDTHTFPVTVSDQRLDITFPSVTADNAMLSGLEIEVGEVSDAAFLDFIQRKMFDYARTEADPATGLVRDKSSSWGPDDNDFGSLAATGFALSAYTVGVEHGWMTADEARARIRRTLANLETGPTAADRVSGFWPHFINVRTGKRYPGSEISNIDSALLIAGAWQAAEYFRATAPDLPATVQRLYDEMDWAWWLNRHPAPDHPDDGFMNQGWTPDSGDPLYPYPGEGGFFRSDWWNRFSETVIIDLLALGSKTHPVPASVWTNMRTAWVTNLGFTFIHEPPLFTQQYHNLYFDFRAVHDGRANYAQNAVSATLYNRAVCVADTALYEPHRWGVTSCSSPPPLPGQPDGYTPYGVPPFGGHNGTVAPTAAITSIFLTPEPSIKAARYMFFQYKHHIWGRHGYTDSFNVAQGYRASHALGIDTLPMVLGIENQRSGLVRENFMRAPPVSQAFLTAGFGPYTGRPLAQASSRQFEAPRVIDGNSSTRWGAEDLPDPQWIGLDFGFKKKMNHVGIDWEAAYAKDYDVQVSEDGIAWRTVAKTVDGDGNRDDVEFTPVETRFVRILCLRRALPHPYSLWEIRADLIAADKNTVPVSATVP